MLIDSGATLNLMSRAFVKALLATHGHEINNSMRDCAITDLPVVRVASGQRVTAIGCIDLRLMLSKDLTSELVPFFIFPDLPVQAIIGNATNNRWKAALSWETKTWHITPKSSEQRVIVPWHSSVPHWRAPLKLVTNGDFVIPPGSHSKVPVVNPFSTIVNHAISGTFGFVSPRKSLTTCMIAHGVANSPTWVQVANPSDKPLLLRHGTHVCDFHSREEWDTKEAFIDPTTEDISSREVTSSALNSGHTPRHTSSQVSKGCQNKAGDSQFQKCINGKGGQGEGLITPIPPCPNLEDITGSASTRETWSTGTVEYVSHRKHPGDQGYQIVDTSLLISKGNLPAWTARAVEQATTRLVRPGMRAGQGELCIHEHGSGVGPMTMTPIPKAGTDTAFVCDPVGPLVNGGRTEEAQHVRQHALWSAAYHRYLDEGTRPEQEPLMVARPGRENLIKTTPSILPMELVEDDNLRSSRSDAPPVHDNTHAPTADLDLCSVCKRAKCAIFTKEEQATFDNLIIDLRDQLGVTVEQTRKDRHQCEVHLLAKWCILQKDVISSQVNSQQVE